MRADHRRMLWRIFRTNMLGATAVTLTGLGAQYWLGIPAQQMRATVIGGFGIPLVITLAVIAVAVMILQFLPTHE